MVSHPQKSSRPITTSVNARHIVVAGQIDLSTEPEVESTLAEASERLVEVQPVRSFLDLSRVAFCSSSGLGLIETFIGATREGPTELCLTSSPAIRRVAVAGVSRFPTLTDRHNQMHHHGCCLRGC